MFLSLWLKVSICSSQCSLRIFKSESEALCNVVCQFARWCGGSVPRAGTALSVRPLGIIFFSVQLV